MSRRDRRQQPDASVPLAPVAADRQFRALRRIQAQPIGDWLPGDVIHASAGEHLLLEGLTLGVELEEV